MSYQVALSEEEDDRIRMRMEKQIRYFKKVYLTITAATKMLKHAVFGQPKEVMGLLQGSYYQDKKNSCGAFYVTDVIHLPVEASETRVTADEETYNIMIGYSTWIDRIKTHNIVGWYHSHPSYGCWLSGIDVNTQERYQKNNDPFLAIVVDPIKSVSLQKIDLGAFRVYPNGIKEENAAFKKDVPRRKLVDFGYHYQRYYQIPIELVTSKIGHLTLKKVEKKQWASALSASTFFNQIDYLTEEVKDEKLDLEQYLELKSNHSVKYEELVQKQADTLKKVAYYGKERNVSLFDQAFKNLLF